MEEVFTLLLGIIILAVIILSWRYFISLAALICFAVFFFTGCGIGIFIMGIIDEPLPDKPITSGFLYWGILVGITGIAGFLAWYTSKNRV
jgi:hypothetical protein